MALWRWVALAMNRSSRLDWGRIEAWAQQVARADLAQVNAVFGAHGALAPRVLWQPTSSHIQTPQLRFLLDYWTKLKGGARLPASRAVDLRALAPIAGHEALLDAVDDGRDFHYQRSNAVLVAITGEDMTGRLVSEYAAGSYSDYFLLESGLALCRAAYSRGEPVYIERAPAGAMMTYAWHSLLLPLADDAGAVGGLLNGVVPIGAAGLPITT